MQEPDDSFPIEHDTARREWLVRIGRGKERVFYSEKDAMEFCKLASQTKKPFTPHHQELPERSVYIRAPWDDTFRHLIYPDHYR
jgi:hypothetical protein